MADSFDDELRFAEMMSETPRKEKKLRIHKRLLLNGDADPQFFLRNREEFGYPCPRSEFIESPEEPTNRALAEKWSTSQAWIRRWRREQSWDAARKRAFQWKERDQWKRSAEALTQLREEELATQRSIMMTMRETLLDTIRLGVVKEQASTGQILERPMGPKDLKDAIASLDLLNKNIERTLGMGQALLKLGEGDAGEASIETVRKIVYNVTVTDNPEPKSLPPGNVIEGDVTVNEEDKELQGEGPD